MDDLAELAQVGMDVPMETTLRLEALRRELGERMEDDPAAVANFGLLMEHGRSMLDRQLRHSLHLLARRQTEVEQLTARVAFLEGRLTQVERQRDRLRDGRWWWWPW